MANRVSGSKFFAFLVLFLFVGIVAVTSCSSRDESGSVESITFGNIALESSALIYVAQDQRYFSDNGLDVTVRDFDTGLDTFGAMMNDEVDVAGMAEWIIVGNAFQQKEFSLITNPLSIRFGVSYRGKLRCGRRRVPNRSLAHW